MREYPGGLLHRLNISCAKTFRKDIIEDVALKTHAAALFVLPEWILIVSAAILNSPIGSWIRPWLHPKLTWSPEPKMGQLTRYYPTMRSLAPCN